MVTTVHLSTNSNETKVVSNLKKANSSKGVPNLNVASKVECPKSLCSTLQFHKVKKQNGWLLYLLSCHQELFISVYWCSDFALVTTLGCTVLCVTVLKSNVLSSLSEQAVKRAKYQPFLLLGHTWEHSCSIKLPSQWREDLINCRTCKRNLDIFLAKCFHCVPRDIFLYIAGGFAGDIEDCMHENS